MAKQTRVNRVAHFPVCHAVLETDAFVQLSGSAKTLYFLLCKARNHHAGKGGWFWRTDQMLVRETGLVRASLSLSRRELIQAGFIECDRQGKRSPTQYRILDGLYAQDEDEEGGENQPSLIYPF